MRRQSLLLLGRTGSTVALIASSTALSALNCAMDGQQTGKMVGDLARASGGPARESGSAKAFTVVIECWK